MQMQPIQIIQIYHLEKNNSKLWVYSSGMPSHQLFKSVTVLHASMLKDINKAFYTSPRIKKKEIQSAMLIFYYLILQRNKSKDLLYPNIYHTGRLEIAHNRE